MLIGLEIEKGPDRLDIGWRELLSFIDDKYDDLAFYHPCLEKERFQSISIIERRATSWTCP